MRLRALCLTLPLLAIVLVAACEDTRPPARRATEWFAPVGQLRAAECIAYAESGNNPNVTGGAGERGIFQIHPVHRRDFERYTGQPWSSAYDANWNGYYAVHLWRSSGRSWRPWSTHRVCHV